MVSVHGLRRRCRWTAFRHKAKQYEFHIWHGVTLRRARKRTKATSAYVFWRNSFYQSTLSQPMPCFSWNTHRISYNNRANPDTHHVTIETTHAMFLLRHAPYFAPSHAPHHVRGQHSDWVFEISCEFQLCSCFSPWWSWLCSQRKVDSIRFYVLSDTPVQLLDILEINLVSSE